MKVKTLEGQAVEVDRMKEAAPLPIKMGAQAPQLVEGARHWALSTVNLTPEYADQTLSLQHKNHSQGDPFMFE